MITIDPEKGTALPPGAEGELCCRTPLNMRCYWNKERQTHSKKRGGGRPPHRSDQKRKSREEGGGGGQLERRREPREEPRKRRTPALQVTFSMPFKH